MKKIKCKLTIPGRIQLKCLSIEESKKSGISWLYHYKAFKEVILKDAQNVDIDKGKLIMLKIKTEGKIWEILIKRKI
jgi:hypothetical protein